MIIKIKDNQLFLYGTIWEGDGTYFLQCFSSIDGNFPVIDVHWHCNGGSVFDGNLMYNAILNAKSICDAHVDGIAASMAAVLLMAFRKVYMVENGFLMIHAPSGYTRGDASQHEASAKLLRSIEKNFIKKLISRTGKTEADVKKWLVGDNWFDAEQALEAKLIDEIVDPVIKSQQVEDPTNNLDNTFSSFAALMVAVGDTDINDNKNPLEMKNEVIAKFGLAGVNAQSSDTAVIQALEDHFKNKTAALETTLEAKTAQVTSLETAITSQREAKIKAILDVAESEKKITAVQRATYENIGKTSGIDALETVISGLGGRTPINSILKNTGNATGITAREGWDWDRYQKEQPRELEAMAEKDPQTFGALYEAKFNQPLNT